MVPPSNLSARPSRWPPAPLPPVWGANVVLLAIASGPVNRKDATYIAHLDELISLAKKNGAYTFLVYRYSEPDDEQPLMPDQAGEDAMAALALRYRNEPAVIYGLQVEPKTGWNNLKPRFTTMIDAIRANNPRSLIVVPGTNWGRYVHWALTEPIQRSNLVYKSHTYDTYDTIMKNYHFLEMAARYPLMLGEFGAGNATSLTDVDRLLDYVESNNISWIGWIFHDKACPCTLSNADTFAPSAYGAEVKARMLAARTEMPSTPSLPLALPSLPLSSAPVIPAAPTPTAVPGVVVSIFDDNLQWQDVSWGTSLNTVEAGSRALGVTHTAPWAGLSLRTPLRSTPPRTRILNSI